MDQSIVIYMLFIQNKHQYERNTIKENNCRVFFFGPNGDSALKGIIKKIKNQSSSHHHEGPNFT